jgi:hypothetical protein
MGVTDLLNFRRCGWAACAQAEKTGFVLQKRHGSNGRVAEEELDEIGIPTRARDETGVRGLVGTGDPDEG